MQICLVLPGQNNAQQIMNYETVHCDHWINIAVDNDPQFAGQVSVLNKFDYTVESNGSLFYCTSNETRCTDGQPRNIVAVFAEERLGEVVITNHNNI